MKDSERQPVTDERLQELEKSATVRLDYYEEADLARDCLDLCAALRKEREENEHWPDWVSEAAELPSENGKDVLEQLRDMRAALAAKEKGCERFRRIGRRMSNVFFNLKQREGDPITKRNSEEFGALQTEWDAALSSTKEGGAS